MKKLRHKEILHHAEEDWEDPEQREDPKNIEPDLPFSMQTRQSDPERPAKKYNPYRYDLIAYRMDEPVPLGVVERNDVRPHENQSQALFRTKTVRV